MTAECSDRRVRYIGVLAFLSLSAFLAVTVTPAPSVADCGAGASCYDLRPYFQLRLGQSVFTDPDSVPQAQLESPSIQPAFGATLGADIGRYFGVEFAGDYVKTALHHPDDSLIGDYSTLSLLGQARLRYPLWNDRLVPYLFAGGGIGFGEFSGREDFDARIGGSDWAPLGVAGAGTEYFVADNVALGLEAKYQFLFRPELDVNSSHPTLTADSFGLMASLRVYLDSLAQMSQPKGTPSTIARDSEALRGYLALRAGSGFFTDPKADSAVGLDDTSGLLGAVAVGMNFNRYLGAELAAEYTRAQLTAPVVGDVAGYPLWTILAQARLRYPVWDDRVTPYVVVGGGVGFGELGDRDTPFTRSGVGGDTKMSPVVAVGAGFEYFLEDNLAIGIEAKHSFLFDTEVEVNGRPADLRPDLVSITAGIRLFFP